MKAVDSSTSFSTSSQVHFANSLQLDLKYGLCVSKACDGTWRAELWGELPRPQTLAVRAPLVSCPSIFFSHDSSYPVKPIPLVWTCAPLNHAFGSQVPRGLHP